MQRFLHTLGGFHGNGYDAVYQHVHVIDVAEMEAARYKRYAFLARYGRQSMLQWSDVEVTEIEKMLRALLELLKEESDTTKAVNDE